MSSTRREFLKAAVVAGVGGTVSSAAIATLQTDSKKHGEHKTDSAQAGGAPFSFIHLTDMHVTPKRWGDKGYRACVESVRALKPGPAFALMGGDMAFDGLYTPKDQFDEQIRLYKEVSGGLGMPYHNCMGNHDPLGWSGRRKCAVDDPEIGKKMIMDRLEWEKSYYSFDHNGWHFVVLDSIHPIKAAHGPGYEPRIGEEQLEWLAHDLGAAGDRPKLCVTHIAALCNLDQINGNTNAKAMNGGMVLWDTKELRQILERHKVKAILQGHSHQIEETRFNGVWYLTSAAVCGAWWSGDWIGCPPGYTVFRCAGNELTWEHQSFPWTEHLEPEDDLERKRAAERAAFKRQQQELLERERRT